MRIVCWQTILMKHHTLFFFFSKIGKNAAKFVMIGALRVNFVFWSRRGKMFILSHLSTLLSSSLSMKLLFNEILLILCLSVSSADNFCTLFAPRSG